MDYGCGEALHADRVAAKAGQLILCEAASNVRDHLAARFASVGNIAVKSPEEVAALPAGTLDLIVMHSVAQYLSQDETDAMFARLQAPAETRRTFRDRRRHPAAGLADHRCGRAAAFCGGQRISVSAVLGLARTTFSDYPKLRAKLGLTLYEEAAMKAKLEAAGFTVERAAKNIGHSQTRMTFIARRANLREYLPASALACNCNRCNRVTSDPVADRTTRDGATFFKPGSSPGPGSTFQIS